MKKALLTLALVLASSAHASTPLPTVPPPVSTPQGFGALPFAYTTQTFTLDPGQYIDVSGFFACKSDYGTGYGANSQWRLMNQTPFTTVYFVCASVSAALGS